MIFKGGAFGEPFWPRFLMFKNEGKSPAERQDKSKLILDVRLILLGGQKTFPNQLILGPVAENSTNSSSKFTVYPELYKQP